MSSKDMRTLVEALPAWTDDSVTRLRHTLAAHPSAADTDHLVTATAGWADETGHDWTGLTWGDLRRLAALLERVQS